MPGPAKVILVEADPAANAALRFGLSRAGLEVTTAADPAAVAEAASSAGLVLVSDGRRAANGKGGAALVDAVRASLEDASLVTPILFVDSAAAGAGQGEGGSEAGGGRAPGDDGPSAAQLTSRRAVERAGAWEVLQGPQALRDIANVARIMLCERRNEGWAGNLIEISGVFGLVRALSALGRSGVLTLTRGVRRGEVRYFHGEITSAQVGMIHGQAAFHQLLLWTDAKFDFRGELIVRRRQIPLTPEELLADAERFLESTRDIAGGLSPSVVLDVVPDKLTALAIKIPPEVHAILNMFDGRRNLVDVLEDSPYRVHDTLRVARKGFETKVLKAVAPHRARPNWKAVVSLEHWLLGAQPVVPREVRSTGVVTGIDDGETIKMAPELSGGVTSSGTVTTSGTVAAIAAAAASGGTGYDVDVTERTPGRSGSGAVVAVTVTSWRDLSALDWSELVPRSSGLEIPMLSPVVPATKTKGEIDAVEAKDPAITQAQQGVGRSVIVSEDAIISPEERAEEERKIEARKQAEQEAERKAAAEKVAAEAAEKEKAAKAAAEAAEKAAAEKEKAEKEKAEKAASEKAALEKAAAEAAEKAAAEKAALEKAAAEAAEKAAAEKVAAEKVATEKVATEKVAAEAAEKAAAEKVAAEKAAAEAAEKAAAEKVAAEKAAAEAAEKAAAEKAASEKAAAEAAEKAALEKAAAEAAEKAAAEKAAAEKAASEKAAAEAAEKAAAEKAAAEKAAAAQKVAAEKAEAEKVAAEGAAAERAAAEKAAMEKAAAEKASEEKSTARLTALPESDEKTSKINRRPTTADVLPKNSKKRDKKKDRKPGADAAPAQSSGSSGSSASGAGPAPRESQQDLSQTAKLGPQATPANPLAKHPRPETAPVIAEEPSVLVADLQAAHTAVSALAKSQAAAASSPDAGGNFDAVVQQVKTDASKATAAFTADEEAFFQAGGHGGGEETFADLDAGYRPRTFWQRLLGRGKTNH